MKYKLIRTVHPYAIENKLRAWDVYTEVWDGSILICECFEVRPMAWYAINGKNVFVGKSRKQVIDIIQSTIN